MIIIYNVYNFIFVYLFFGFYNFVELCDCDVIVRCLFIYDFI